MLNLDKYGSYQAFKWTHDYLMQVLSTGKNPIIKKQNLLTAFRKIKREDFIPEAIKEQAYEDKDLNIGDRVTIRESKPYSKNVKWIVVEEKNDTKTK